MVSDFVAKNSEPKGKILIRKINIILGTSVWRGKTSTTEN